jgi:uncharacterized protein (DUF433 family)
MADGDTVLSRGSGKLDSMAVTFDIGSLLDSDPAYWEGRPFVRGKRVTVQRIAIAHARGESASQIADDYDLELAEVHAALTYYFVNKDQIDADVAAYDAETERIATAKS